MSKIFNQVDKENVINSIKMYIDIFSAELKNENKIIFFSYKNSTNNKNIKSKRYIKIAASIWGMIILTITLFVVYNEMISPLAIDIYIKNSIFVLSIVLFAVFLYIKILNIKRINKMVLDRKDLILFTTNGFKIGNEKNVQKTIYPLTYIDFYITNRKSSIKDNMRNNSNNFYIIYNNKKKKFLIKYSCEEQFFAFLLFIKSLLSDFSINDITNEELYEMYHTQSYGLFIKYKQ